MKAFAKYRRPKLNRPQLAELNKLQAPKYSSKWHSTTSGALMSDAGKKYRGDWSLHGSLMCLCSKPKVVLLVEMITDIVTFPIEADLKNGNSDR